MRRIEFVSLASFHSDRTRWISRIGFVTLFFALTVLPIISATIGMNIVTPVDENRSLAQPPVWNRPPHLSVLLGQADRWFNDHFGLRSFLIRLKTQIDYSIFRTSNRVHIGSDGWLFYRSVMDVEKPSVEDLLSREEAQVIAGFVAFNDALREKGVRLIIVPNLLADRFVANELPSTVPRLRSPTRFDHLLATLASLPNLAYVDTPVLLNRTQRSRQVFHKTDFHWNDPAAFEVGRALVDLIGRLEGRIKPIWAHRLDVETRRESGGIAMFMPLFLPPSENGLFLKKTWTDLPGRSELINQGPYEDIVHNMPNKELLPPVLVVGDSFFDGIGRSGFDSYFRDTYRMRWGPKTKISDIAAALPADAPYVIVQFIEVSRGALLAFADHTDVAIAVSIIEKRQMVPANIKNP